VVDDAHLAADDFDKPPKSAEVRVPLLPLPVENRFLLARYKCKLDTSRSLRLRGSKELDENSLGAVTPGETLGTLYTFGVGSNNFENKATHLGPGAPFRG